MDTIVSSSTPLLRSRLPSLCPSTTTAPPPSNLLCSTSFSKSAHCSVKHLFFRSSSQRRKYRSHTDSTTFPQFRVSCGIISEITESEFSSRVLQSDRPVLVEFVAKWCGPCRLIAPAMESIAQEYEEKLTVVKLDHDANPRLIEQYKVYGLPALILFKNGQEVPESRKEGAMTKVKLKEYVDTLLEIISVA